MRIQVTVHGSEAAEIAGERDALVTLRDAINWALSNGMDEAMFDALGAPERPFCVIVRRYGP